MIKHVVGQLILGVIAMLKTGTLYLMMLNAIGDLLIIWGLTLFIWIMLRPYPETRKIENFNQKSLTNISWGISMLFAISLNF